MKPNEPAVKKAICKVIIKSPENGGFKKFCSGFVITASGYVITVGHVFDNNNEGKPCWNVHSNFKDEVFVQFLGSETQLKADLHYGVYDAKSGIDFAFLKIRSELKLNPLELAITHSIDGNGYIYGYSAINNSGRTEEADPLLYEIKYNTDSPIGNSLENYKFTAISEAQNIFGFSGCPAYSDFWNGVIGVQSEEIETNKTAFIMPLSRIFKIIKEKAVWLYKKIKDELYVSNIGLKPTKKTIAIRKELYPSLNAFLTSNDNIDYIYIRRLWNWKENLHSELLQSIGYCFRLGDYPY